MRNGNDNSGEDTTDHGIQSNDQEYSCERNTGLEPAYNEVMDNGTSEPEYNYITYPLSDHLINPEDDHMIYNVTYQSLRDFPKIDI